MRPLLKKLRQGFRSSSRVKDLDVRAYCELRAQQWEGQAQKDYGPVPGAAVVADDKAWREWEAFGVKNLLIDLLRGLPGDRKRLLDFGCGVGRVQRDLLSKFNRVDGADMSETALAGAVTYCGTDKVILVEQEDVAGGVDVRSRLFTCNGYSLPEIPDNYYDAVFSVLCLIHVLHPDVRRSLYNSFYRVVQPGGKCILQFFVSNSEAFGRCNVVDVERGAFAFRNLQEIEQEFLSSPWSVDQVQLYDPIKTDHEGGVEKLAFVTLVKS